MKKFVVLFFALFFCTCLFAQTNLSVSIEDEVYSVLKEAETKGYCEPLFTSKPYTERYILSKLDEISQNILDRMAEFGTSYVLSNEYDVVEAQKERFVHKKGFDLSHLSVRAENKNEKFPVTFEFDNNFEGFVSTGVYTDSDFNSTGYELFYDFNFSGDILRNVSYDFEAYIGLTHMPMTQIGDNYVIGTWLYDNDPENPGPGAGVIRTINTFKNYAVLPYSYKKFWDGSAYFLSNISASGLEGWPFVPAMCFGMKGEIRGSFFDSKLEIGISRKDREWVAMDDGASLVLNSMARPFLAFDARVKPFKAVTLSTLTGVLEYPNQEYITENAWNYATEYLHTNTNDAYYFQNAFSLLMLELDFKYFHFDFGSSCVWPKRYELGYFFPFIDNVVYQNDIGDNDNLALFGDFKFIKPGVISVWISGYLDEMPKASPSSLFKKTRYMFAFQGGTKVALPFLPFATLSFRYTKVEPYCYTHHGINYTPWYSHYISESYTNNGSSLGYYLPPNSDEFHVRVEAKPTVFSTVALQYQLIRHGVNFGNRQIPGSDLYSELPNQDRDSLYKYFLKDGCYEWSNIISLSGSYDLRQMKVPVTLNATAGFIYDWFTDTDEPVGTKGSYHKVDTQEYPTTSGVILSVGFKAFF